MLFASVLVSLVISILLPASEVSNLSLHLEEDLLAGNVKCHEFTILCLLSQVRETAHVKLLPTCAEVIVQPLKSDRSESRFKTGDNEFTFLESKDTPVKGTR